jgi:ABC-type Fe2+-enterobactin transport system substrate-binding protein
MPTAVAIAGFLLALSAAGLASAVARDADRLPSYITFISAQLDAASHFR